MFSTARSYSVTRSAPMEISFFFPFCCLYQYGLFILDPVPVVSGSALLMISPALKANETRKSWISLRFGFSMVWLGG